MSSTSYTQALYSYYYSFIENDNEELSASIKKKSAFLSKYPEFATFDQFISTSKVILSMFKLTMENMIDHMPENAIFYADKLKTLTNNDEIVLFLLGKIFEKFQD